MKNPMKPDWDTAIAFFKVDPMSEIISSRHPQMLSTQPEVFDMKISLNQFDFTKLSNNSVLVCRLNESGATTRREVDAYIMAFYKLQKIWKIPKGVFVLMCFGKGAFDLKVIPEKIMNKHGWFKK